MTLVQAQWAWGKNRRAMSCGDLATPNTQAAATGPPTHAHGASGVGGCWLAVGVVLLLAAVFGLVLFFALRRTHAGNEPAERAGRVRPPSRSYPEPSGPWPASTLPEPTIPAPPPAFVAAATPAPAVQPSLPSVPTGPSQWPPVATAPTVWSLGSFGPVSGPSLLAPPPAWSNAALPDAAGVLGSAAAPAGESRYRLAKVVVLTSPHMAGLRRAGGGGRGRGGGRTTARSRGGGRGGGGRVSARGRGRAQRRGATQVAEEEEEENKAAETGGGANKTPAATVVLPAATLPTVPAVPAVPRRLVRLEYEEAAAMAALSASSAKRVCVYDTGSCLDGNCWDLVRPAPTDVLPPPTGPAIVIDVERLAALPTQVLISGRGYFTVRT